MMMNTTQQKLEDEDRSNARSIPSDIIHEILSRVSSIKALNKCRIVCKSWAEIVSKPEFAELHVSRSPTACLVCQPQNEKFHHIDVHDSDNDTSITVAPCISVPSNLQLTNTCNGLICLIILHGFKEPSENIYVLNPLLRKEYISVPLPSYDIYMHDSLCFMGFCRLTNQYKILCCFGYYSELTSDYANYAYKAEIYTLGEGLWKNVDVNDPAYIRHAPSNYGIKSACIDGVLHWIPLKASAQIICCFDFVTEQFCWVPGPCDLIRLGVYDNQKIELGVVNEKLSIRDCRRDHINIWVMSEYGVKESWSKHVVINSNKIGKSCNLIMFTTAGNVLLVRNGASTNRKSRKRIKMKIYNPISQKSEYEVKIPEISSEYLWSVAYTPSLISLKDVAKGENEVHPSSDINLKGLFV